MIAPMQSMAKRIVAIAGFTVVAALGLALAGAPAQAQAEFGSPELIAAAKKEGKLVFYTTNYAEVEEQVIKEFNKRFPEIKIEMVRAPGGQLITRIKTEAAAGKLIADVVDHSDRALMLPLIDMFQDYAPPNAADYIPDAQISPNLWPRTTLAWSIAYNTELVKNPPNTWMDLTKPEYDKTIGAGDRAVRRHDLDPHHVRAPGARRGLLGEAGGDPADALSVRRADVGCAGARRDRDRAAALQRDLLKQKDGAPIKIFFPPEGAPINPYAAGIPKTAAHPNAAKLFLNWCLSEEGQTFMIKELGNITSLKVPPIYPGGLHRQVIKIWLPKFDDYVKLHGPWMADWDKTYGYRQ